MSITCSVRLGHMSLNSSTWKDRDGVKVRASSGLSAADYFGFAMESLFLWGKIIRELGRGLPFILILRFEMLSFILMYIKTIVFLGYDEGSMHMASFDWRLSMKDLEERDKYFTRLKVVCITSCIMPLDICEVMDTLLVCLGLYRIASRV